VDSRFEKDNYVYNLNISGEDEIMTNDDYDAYLADLLSVEVRLRCWVDSSGIS
jgi:hypothetical protein